MTQVEDFHYCECIKDRPTITYIWDSSRKEIRFYPFLDTNNISLEFKPIKIEKVRVRKNVVDYAKNVVDYSISCPVCGNKCWEYTGVPSDWKVFPALDKGLRLLSIPVDKIPDDFFMEGE